MRSFPPPAIPAATSRLAAGRALWAAPLAGLWQLAVWLRGLAYDVGLRTAARAPLLVISVGGLEAGGTGKTPVADALVAELVARGLRVGLLTRGYRRRRRGLVVADGRHGQAGHLAGAIGDEAALLLGRHPTLTVAAAARRWTGAQALASLGCDVAVMDDGFVHRALARDLDIVVVRAERPLGDGRFLPWGSLRERPQALARAQIIWLWTGVADGPAANARLPRPASVAVPAALLPYLPRGDRMAPVCLRGGAHVRRIYDGQGHNVCLRDRPVLVVTGIARPQNLRRLAQQQGAQVRALWRFADHHPYRAGDVARILTRAASLNVAAVLISEKDAVKLRPLWPAGALPLWTVALGVRPPPWPRRLWRLLPAKPE